MSKHAKNIIDNPRHFDKALKSQKYLEDRYPLYTNSLLFIGGSQSKKLPTPMTENGTKEYVGNKDNDGDLRGKVDNLDQALKESLSKIQNILKDLKFIEDGVCLELEHFTDNGNTNEMRTLDLVLKLPIKYQNKIIGETVLKLNVDKMGTKAAKRPNISHIGFSFEQHFTFSKEDSIVQNYKRNRSKFYSVKREKSFFSGHIFIDGKIIV